MPSIEEDEINVPIAPRVFWDKDAKHSTPLMLMMMVLITMVTTTIVMMIVVLITINRYSQWHHVQYLLNAKNITPTLVGGSEHFTGQLLRTSTNTINK